MDIYFLANYLCERFAHPTTKTAKKGVTSASFAMFLREHLPFMKEFRDAVFGENNHIEYINHETGVQWTLNDLETDIDTGLELVASDVISEREAGAELVISVAKRGRVAAVLLYAAHCLADSEKKADIEQAKVWLYAIVYERRGNAIEHLIAKNLFEDYLACKDESAPFPAPPTTVEEHDNLCENYASIVDTENDGTKSVLGEDIRGVAIIGNVRIVCGWFDKLVNIIEKDDYIDAYFPPNIATWYAIQLLVEKVGKEKLNALAGVCLYSDQEDDPTPAVLQYPLEGDNSIALTHYLYPGTNVALGDAYISIVKNEADEVSFANDEEDDKHWYLSIPETWDYQTTAGQRRLIRMMNSKIATIAEALLPEKHQSLLEIIGQPNGKCTVSLNNNYDWEENEDGGVDVTVPFSLIKFREDIIESVLLSGYEDEGNELEMGRKRWYDGLTDGYSTTVCSKKLYDKKLKYYPGDFFLV